MTRTYSQRKGRNESPYLAASLWWSRCLPGQSPRYSSTEGAYLERSYLCLHRSRHPESGELGRSQIIVVSYPRRIDWTSHTTRVEQAGKLPSSETPFRRSQTWRPFGFQQGSSTGRSRDWLFQSRLELSEAQLWLGPTNGGWYRRRPVETWPGCRLSPSRFDNVCHHQGWLIPRSHASQSCGMHQWHDAR